MQRHMIGRVTTEGQESGRTTGPDDYQVDKASRVLLEAVLAAMCCGVLDDAIVAVSETENGIGYVRLPAVPVDKAA